ncbi:MAG: FixH family protein [Pseudomonadota bacterium]|nr:FixH family protein [Pseudomonadota bacterium]
MVVIGIVAGCGDGAPPAANDSVVHEVGGRRIVLNIARTRASKNQLFTVTIDSGAEPIALNRIATWTVRVQDAQGRAVENARIGVEGGMPEHNHGLPTAPRVTADLGGGDYRLEGVKFQMPGWWVVKLHITAYGASDTVTFNLML